jgi:hypothetical protein
MTGRGQRWKTSIATAMGAARTVSHRCPPPLEIAARFPHSHRADGFLPIPDSERNRTSLWAVEKWKSKTTIPTFPPPRSACGARKEIDSSLSEPPPSHEERSTFPCTRYFTRPGSSFDEKMLRGVRGPYFTGNFMDVVVNASRGWIPGTIHHELRCSGTLAALRRTVRTERTKSIETLSRLREKPSKNYAEVLRNQR